MIPKFYKCADCGGRITTNPLACGGVGYGVDSKGRKICYDCCGKRDCAEMIETGRFSLYLSVRDGKPIVTNWPGSLVFSVSFIRKGRHNWAGTREDVWFTGPDGRNWWGVCIGGNSTICRCRRLRAA
jgi:hypothetical protein